MIETVTLCGRQTSISPFMEIFPCFTQSRFGQLASEIQTSPSWMISVFVPRGSSSFSGSVTIVNERFWERLKVSVIVLFELWLTVATSTLAAGSENRKRFVSQKPKTARNMTARRILSRLPSCCLWEWEELSVVGRFKVVLHSFRIINVVVFIDKTSVNTV